ncbi:MAG: CDP-diacylglycerol--serine O-phosphatidyltransferase [Planctomyces sp.]|nr:CDP-diacylglycerol--serine O-phosphatidyltransferase [Planctomyces sp.]
MREPSPRRNLNRKQKMFAVFPTLLTLGNAACGFGSITFAAKIGPETSDGNSLFIAAALIYLAMLFDALDGRVARWAKQTSDFGAQLDSLCDAISSGVAPAFLMLQYSREYPSRFSWMIAALFVLCAVLRLARFNVETDEEDTHQFFSGLPAPAAAGLIASFPIAKHGLLDWREGATEAWVISFLEWLIYAMQKGLPFIMLAAAVLMVSRVRYVHFFNAFVGGRLSRKQMIQIVFTLGIVFVVRELALPLMLCYIAFRPPLQAFWKEFRAGRLSSLWADKSNATEDSSMDTLPLETHGSDVSEEFADDGASEDSFDARQEDRSDNESPPLT